MMRLLLIVGGLFLGLTAASAQGYEVKVDINEWDELSTEQQNSLEEGLASAYGKDVAIEGVAAADPAFFKPITKSVASCQLLCDLAQIGASMGCGFLSVGAPVCIAANNAAHAACRLDCEQ